MSIDFKFLAWKLFLITNHAVLFPHHLDDPKCQSVARRVVGQANQHLSQLFLHWGVQTFPELRLSGEVNLECKCQNLLKFLHSSCDMT